MNVLSENEQERLREIVGRRASRARLDALDGVTTGNARPFYLALESIRTGVAHPDLRASDVIGPRADSSLRRALRLTSVVVAEARPGSALSWNASMVRLECMHRLERAQMVKELIG